VASRRPRVERGGLARGGETGRRTDRQREAHQQPATRQVNGSPVRRSPRLGRPGAPVIAPVGGETQEQPLAGVAAGTQHRKQRHRGSHAQKTVPAQAAARAEDESDGHSESYGNPQGAVGTKAHGHRSLDGWTG